MKYRKHMNIENLKNMAMEKGINTQEVWLHQGPISI